jgi:hypothetical protein
MHVGVHLHDFPPFIMVKPPATRDERKRQDPGEVGVGRGELWPRDV